MVLSFWPKPNVIALMFFLLLVELARRLRLPVLLFYSLKREKLPKVSQSAKLANKSSILASTEVFEATSECEVS